jgi:putative transposase
MMPNYSALVLAIIRETKAAIASILCETEIEKHLQVDKSIGLDLGIKSYLVTSSGEEIKNPKHYRTLLKKLLAANKKLSRTQKCSNQAKAKTKRSPLGFTNV